jgi:cardiolipin synthase
MDFILPSSIVIVLHWTVVILVSLRVIMRRPPVGVALAWIAVVLSVPFIGFAIYLLIGEHWLGRDRRARIRDRVDLLKDWQRNLPFQIESVKDDPEDTTDPIRRHTLALLGYPVQEGNKIELIYGRDRSFDALIADINAAKHSCDLAYYIWENDGRAAEVVSALIRAADRGVRCRAMADAVGSKDFLKGRLARKLRDSGVELLATLPTGLVKSWIVRGDLRNHRKIIVIDDVLAYTGSQNMVDPWFFKRHAGTGMWVDAVTRISGPAAATLGGVFEMDWSVESAMDCALPEYPPDAEHPGEAHIQVIPSGPDHSPGAIHEVLLTAIYSAQHELILTTPYFVPDEALETALCTASHRGVKVTLVVPEKIDSRLARFAGASNYVHLLESGVTIQQFKGGLLHTKSITIDGHASIFGSVNLDMRSLWLNFEISLVIYDRAFTSELLELQQDYISKSTQLDLETWNSRSFFQRLLENAARLLGPVL